MFRWKSKNTSSKSTLLAMRSNPNHMKQLEELNVDTIDFVVVNLYPFKQTILKEGVKREEAIENIDIGGPTMLRSAAKNYQDVTVITDPNDYEKVLTELKENGQVSLDTKFYLMNKVFEHTASYDAMICKYLKEERKDNSLPKELTLTYEKVEEMRYGENPHQIGALYKENGKCEGSLTIAKQLNGKQLSFNNINDTNGALELLKEFDEPTVVACKHGNPCGVGSSSDIYEAWKKAFEADKTSIFGGIVVANREITKAIAQYKVVTDRKPTDKELEDMLFTWKIVKYVKSNGIALGKDKQSIGIGPGQVNRIWATEQSVEHAEELIGEGVTKGAVLASDAFFPFSDCVEAAHKAGITAIIQPGGSIRDQDSIDKCNEYGIAMIFTGMRHFRH